MRKLLIAIIVFSLDIVLFNSFSYAKTTNNLKYYRQFQNVFEKIEQDYVVEPDKQKMLDSALDGMISSLDPHSSYLAGEDLEDFMTSTKGEFGGIGVEIILDSGAVKVVSPIDDLPAHKAGIRSGDFIIKIDNEFVSDLGFIKAAKNLRGKPGTKVNVVVIREGETKPLEFELKREIVKLATAKSHMEEDILYVRIPLFNENAFSELKKSITKFSEDKKNNIKGFILDLRNNPGGLVDQAVSISEFFLKDQKVVSMKGRNVEEVNYFANPKSEKAPSVPMVILINEGTVSASEIVSGALQDNKRAILVGAKTFGKGSVQVVFPLNERSAMKITTSKYYTPSGKSIQAEGIKPDIYVEQVKIDYKQDNEQQKKFLKYHESSLKNHIKNDEDKKETSSEDNKNTEKQKKFEEMSDIYKKDYQYARAFDLLRGLIILDSKNDR